MTRPPTEARAAGDSRVAARLADAGYALPTVPEPRGTYVGARRDGALIRVSGHTDRGRADANGSGPLTADSDLATARRAATLAALHLVAAVSKVVDDLDDVTEVVHLRGYVTSAADFDRHPQVIDAASELLDVAFAPQQRHTRVAIGVASLPGGALVELEATFRVGRSA